MPKEPKGLTDKQKAKANEVKEVISEALGERANSVSSDTLSSNSVPVSNNSVPKLNKYEYIVDNDTSVGLNGVPGQHVVSKVSGGNAFMEGMTNVFKPLINTASKGISKLANTKIGEAILDAGNANWFGGEDQKEAFKKDIQDTEAIQKSINENNEYQDILKEKYPLQYQGGDFLTKAGLYKLGGTAAEGSALESSLTNAIGETGANLAVGQMLDTGVETVPGMLEDIENGKSAKDVLINAAKNEGVNALYNLGGEGLKYIPQIPKLVKGGIDALTSKPAVETAENVVENAAKSAPIDPLNLAKQNEQGIDALANQQKQASEALQELSEQLPKQNTENVIKGKGNELADNMINQRINNAIDKADYQNTLDGLEKYEREVLDRANKYAANDPELQKLVKDYKGVANDSWKNLMGVDQQINPDMVKQHVGLLDEIEERAAKNVPMVDSPVGKIRADKAIPGFNDVSEESTAFLNSKKKLAENADNLPKMEMDAETYDKARSYMSQLYDGIESHGTGKYTFSEDAEKKYEQLKAAYNYYKEEIESANHANIMDAKRKVDNARKALDTALKKSDPNYDGFFNKSAFGKSIDNARNAIGMGGKADNVKVDKNGFIIPEETDLPMETNYAKPASEIQKESTEKGLKQLNKPETFEPQPVKNIKDEKLKLDLQFFADNAKKIEQKIDSMPDGEEKNSLKKILSDFWARLRGAKTKEEAEEAWDSVSKTRETMKKSGFFTDEELDTIYPEADARYAKESMEGTVEDAKDYITRRPNHAKGRYTKTYKNDKEAGAELANSRDISGMHLMSRDLTEQARATKDPNKKRELYAQARKVLSNLYIANREAGRAGNINKYFGGDPQAIMESAQGYAEHAVEKAMAKEPKLQAEIGEVAKTIDDWLGQMDKQALTREEIEKMVDNALLRQKRLRKRVGKDDVKRLSDAILNEKQFCDIQRHLEFLSTGYRDIDGDVMEKARNLFDEAKKLNLNSKKRLDMENEGYQMIAKQIAPNGGTFRDKLDAWRYLSMLANPTTHLKNMLGNLVFGKGMVSAKNDIAALLEAGADKVSKAMGKGGIDRTKSILNPIKDADLIKASGEDGLENAFRELSGSHFFDTGKSLDNAIPAFNTKTPLGKFLNKASDLNAGALSKEDEMAMMAKYKTSLAGFLKANGADASIFKSTDEEAQQLLESGRQYAINQAKEAAFHQDTPLMQKISNLSQDLRAGTKGERAAGLVLDTIIPFKKTPANILKSAFAYSPLEWVKVLADINTLRRGADAAGNAFKAADLIDDIAKAATGTGAFGIGYILAHEGILKVGSDLTDEESSFDKQTGRQNVSLILSLPGIKPIYIPIQELMPSAAPVIMGGTAYETLKNKTDEDTAINTFGAGIGAIANGLIDMSMLSGISDTLMSVRGAKTGQEVAQNLMVSAAGNLASQMLPTVGRKANVTIDDTKRDTYSDKTGLAKTIDKQAKYLQTKVPMLQQVGETMKKSDVPVLQKVGNRLALQPNIDVKGQIVESPGVAGNNGLLARAANNFLSPVGNITQDTSTKYDEERRRLEKATGEKKVLPYIGSDENDINGRKLSPEEWTQYKQARGQLREIVASAVIDNKAYKDMSDVDKAAALVKVDTFTKAIAQGKFGKEISSDNKDLAKIYKKKGPEGVANALITNAKTKGIMGDLSADKTSKALVEKGDYDGLKKYADIKQMMNDYGFKADQKITDYIQSSSNKEQAVKDLANVKNSNISPQAYIHAKTYLPSMKAPEFVTAYKGMDSDSNGSVKQSEVIDYANKHHLSESEMQNYWKAFGQDWKTIPSIKDGVWSTPKRKRK